MGRTAVLLELGKPKYDGWQPDGDIRYTKA